MEKNIENLLSPRYKVINLWPWQCPYKIGDIIHEDLNIEGATFFKKTVHEFPHLFKKLLWFEDREISEMPEYFMYVKTIHHDLAGHSKTYKDIYVKVQEWDNVNGRWFPDNYKHPLHHSSRPITEQEYTDYLTQKNK